ncbi:MAG: AI-2E family transporter, partial [Gemmatimonadetes bacterium]|nr:AI-2E family transporter [Gemmatimonadota bacterium]
MSESFLDSPRNVTGAIILALGIAIAIALSPFAIGLLGAMVLTVLVGPVHRRIASAIGGSRASALVVALTALLILIPGGAMLGLVIGEGPGAIRGVQDNAVLSWLREQRFGGVDLGAQLAKASGTLLEWVSAQALGLVGSAARGTINLIIALFGLYFLLESGSRVWERTKRYLPFSDANADALHARFVSVTQATFLGLAATAVLQGTLVGIGFAVVGLPGAAFWGVMTAIASVIPVVGGAIVWVPGVAVLLVEQEYLHAAILAGVGGVLVTNIDNVVRPYIFRRVSNVHPLVTLVGALAGLRYFGLLGVLMGPLAITYFFELLRIYDEEYGVTEAAREFALLRTTAQLRAEAAAHGSGGSAPSGGAPTTAAAGGRAAAAPAPPPATPDR